MSHSGRGPSRSGQIRFHVDGRDQVVASAAEVMDRAVAAEIVAALVEVAAVALAATVDRGGRVMVSAAEVVDGAVAADIRPTLLVAARDAKPAIW